MDLTHKLRHILPVFFSIAKENITVECGADLPRKFFSDEYVIKISPELIIKTQHGRILCLFIQILKLPAAAIKKLLQPWLLHKRQNRDMLPNRKRKFYVNGSILRRQELRCDWHDKQLHLLQIGKRYRVPARRFTVPDRTVLLFEYSIGYAFKTIRKIIRMAAEEHPWFSLRAAHLTCVKAQALQNIYLLSTMLGIQCVSNILNSLSLFFLLIVILVDSIAQCVVRQQQEKVRAAIDCMMNIVYKVASAQCLVVEEDGISRINQITIQHAGMRLGVLPPVANENIGLYLFDFFTDTSHILRSRISSAKMGSYSSPLNSSNTRFSIYN